MGAAEGKASQPPPSPAAQKAAGKGSEQGKLRSQGSVSACEVGSNPDARFYTPAQGQVGSFAAVPYRKLHEGPGLQKSDCAR